MSNILGYDFHIKPLEWLSEEKPFFAVTPFCSYRISSVDDDTGPHWEVSISYRGSCYQRHDTEAAAKASAQENYRSRVLSALSQFGESDRAQASIQDDLREILDWLDDKAPSNAYKLERDRLQKWLQENQP